MSADLPQGSGRAQRSASGPCSSQPPARLRRAGSRACRRRGRVTWERGRGRRRGEPRCPPLPPPGGGARARPWPAAPLRAPPRPLLTRQAWLGCLPRPTPPEAGEGGEGRGEKWASSLASPEGAETLGHRGSGSSSPSHSLPPLYPCGGPEAGGGGARTEAGDNCQLEAYWAGGRGGGRERRRSTPAPPSPPSPALQVGASCERSKEEHRRRRR